MKRRRPPSADLVRKRAARQEEKEAEEARIAAYYLSMSQSLLETTLSPRAVVELIVAYAQQSPTLVVRVEGGHVGLESRDYAVYSDTDIARILDADHRYTDGLGQPPFQFASPALPHVLCRDDMMNCTAQTLLERGGNPEGELVIIQRYFR